MDLHTSMHSLQIQAPSAPEIKRAISLFSLVQKVQREIIETNEALGIDIVKIVVTTASIGLNVAAEVGGYEDAGKKVKLVGRIAKAILGKGKDDAKTIASSGEENVQEISKKSKKRTWLVAFFVIQ